MFSIIFGEVLDALGGSPSIEELVSQVNKVTLLYNSFQTAGSAILASVQTCTLWL